MVSTACGRGYVAHWRMSRGKLYLARIQPFAMPLHLNESLKDAYQRHFAMVFGSVPSPKFANWFSGELRLGYGDLDDRFDTCYVYQNGLKLQVLRGVLVEQVRAK